MTAEAEENPPNTNLDPARREGAPVARKVTLNSPAAVGAVAKALVNAAKWVGAETVVVEQVEPPSSAPRLRATLESGT